MQSAYQRVNSLISLDLIAPDRAWRRKQHRGALYFFHGDRYQCVICGQRELMISYRPLASPKGNGSKAEKREVTMLDE